MQPLKPLSYERLEMTTYSRSAVGGLSVTVVGCGALGSEVSRLLGLLGLGSVLLIDPDRVEATNFTHSTYLRSTNAIGRPKAEVLAQNLSSHFPDTRWQSLSCEIADTGFQRLQGSAVVFSCTDNVLARVETCYAAHRLQLPMMDAGLKGHAFWSGRVAWLPGGLCACYLCQLSEARRAELLSLSLADSQSCSADLRDDQILPSTPTMASIVAGLQVDLGLRLALAKTEHPIQACAWELSLPLPETNWRSFNIPRSVDCPWHGSDSDSDVSLDLVKLPMDLALTESLAQLQGDSGQQPPSLELDWPLCVNARCDACQHLWSPMLRLASLRRRASCPVCGQSRLRPIETLSRISHGDLFARLTPRQLGLPSDHLFTLSRANLL
jgi:molybdopterin/thiamine biosynthesis adenylyltransferase